MHDLMSKMKSGSKLTQEELYTVCIFEDGSFTLKDVKDIYQLADLKFEFLLIYVMFLETELQKTPVLLSTSNWSTLCLEFSSNIRAKLSQNLLWRTIFDCRASTSIPLCLVSLTN